MDLQAILIALGGLVASLVGVVKILEYLEIKPQHIRHWFGKTKPGEDSVSEPLPPNKKRMLAFAVFLFALSFTFFAYTSYRISQRPTRTIACGMSFLQQNFIPINSPWSSGLRVTIIPDRERGRVQLLIIYDEAIGLAPKEGKLTKGGQFQVEAQGLMQSYPDVWNVKWKTPTWNSDDPVTFEFLSERPIRVTWVLPIGYNPGS